MEPVAEVKSDEDIVKLVKDARTGANSSDQSDWRTEARSLYDMVAGRQWSVEDEAALDEQGRVPVVFNRMGTVIDAVAGSEVNNRQEVRYIPREIGDVAENEVLTSAAQWVRDNCDAEDEESDAFYDVLVSGMGFTETRMDYEQDDEGQCIIERIDPIEVRWDPSSRKRNLADGRWIQREKKFARDEIEARWPGYEVGEPNEEQDDGETPHVRDPEDQYKGGEKGTTPKRLYSVIQHQWYELECIYKVLSPDSGQIIEIPKDRYEELQKIAPLEGAKIHRRVYKQAFVCGDTLLEVGPGPCAKGFTIQAITGKRDRNKNTWYGLARPMNDPQKWANKFFSQLLHIINTNAKGGLMMETGAVENVRKFEETWAKSDSVSVLKPGGLGKVQPKTPPLIPPVISELMNFSISSIRDTPGVSLELLGMADRQQAGYLEAQRTKAGLTILAGLFDSLRQYRKRQGRVLAWFIDEYLSDGRLIKIVGKEKEQFVPLIRGPDSMKYDVIVDSAPTSRDMKERAWAATMELLPLIKDMGVPIPPEIIKYSPLPSGLVAAWLPKLMEAQKKAEMGDPMQKQMQQTQLEKVKSEVEKNYASADQSQAAAMKSAVEAMNAAVLQLQSVIAGQFPQPGPGMQQAPQMPPPMQPPGPPMQPPPMQPPMGGMQ